LAVQLPEKNWWISYPFKVNGIGIRGWEGIARKEAYTVQTVNIISHWPYFVA
jgi:hypothetical protein